MQINMFHKSAYHLHEDWEVKLLKMQENRICPWIVLCCQTTFINLLKQITFLLLIHLFTYLPVFYLFLRTKKMKKQKNLREIKRK